MFDIWQRLWYHHKMRIWNLLIRFLFLSSCSICFWRFFNGSHTIRKMPVDSLRRHRWAKKRGLPHWVDICWSVWQSSQSVGSSSLPCKHDHCECALHILMWQKGHSSCAYEQCTCNYTDTLYTLYTVQAKVFTLLVADMHFLAELHLRDSSSWCSDLHKTPKHTKY